MLPPPPCIEPLIGCREGGPPSSGSGSGVSSWDSSASNSSSSLPSGLGFGHRSSSSISSLSSFSSSSSRNSFFTPAGSSSSSLRFLSRSTGSSSPNTTSENRRSEYTVTVRNTGTTQISGIMVTHGPVPQNVVFDTSRSTPGCYQNGSDVICFVDLVPGESKQLMLSYAASSFTSCTTNKALQVVKLSPGTSATATVSCVMKTVALSWSSSSASSFSSSVFSSFSSVSTLRSSSISYSSASSVSSTAAVLTTDVTDGTALSNGFEPYATPRTGAGDSYFAQRAVSGNLLRPLQTDSDWPITPIVSILLSICMLAALVAFHFWLRDDKK